MYNKVMLEKSILEEQIGELLTHLNLTLAIAELYRWTGEPPDNKRARIIHLLYGWDNSLCQ